MLCRYGHNWCLGIVSGNDPDKQCVKCYADSVRAIAASIHNAPASSVASAAHSIAAMHDEASPSSSSLTFDALMERLLAMDEPVRQRAYILLHASGCKINR